MFDLIISAWSVLEPLTGLVSAVGVLRLLHERAAQRRSVDVVLVLSGEGRELALPLELTRGEVSRAEILGRLGMLPMATPGARFALRHLSRPEFLRDLRKVAEGEHSVLVIPCSPEEFEQFAV